MKTIIAGTRTITDASLVAKAVELSRFDITEVVSGAARGVDTLGEMWARSNHVPIKRFPADWTGFGKAAGFIRNQEMAEYADALIAITTGSSGTAHMIRAAEARNMPVFILKLV